MPRAPRTKQSKTVTLIYGGISAVLLIVIAALALVFVPPSPPSVAEFAPQAQDTIEEAPNQQSSQFGGGPGGACALGQKCDVEAASLAPTKRAVIDKARVRRCVGDPPRQIEDPQSPPCVQFWEGDNGGTTWKGVTGDDIKIAYPTSQVATWTPIVQAYANFFNRRFEFYGRKLTIIPVLASTASYDDPPVQRSVAQKVDEEVKAFASTPYLGGLSNDSPFYDELTRRRIIGVHNDFSTRTQADFTKNRPYQWGFEPALDELQLNLGEWICKWLHGRNAEYAGPSLRLTPRKFAVLLQAERSGIARADFLASKLSDCEESLLVAEFPPDEGSAQGRNQMRLILADFQRQGATTIGCYCQQYGAPMDAAQLNGYEPEWLISGGESHSKENNFRAEGHPPNQRLRLFGLHWNNRLSQPSDEPWWWGIQEGNPNHDPTSAYVTKENASTAYRPTYQSLLLVASGIQMAGPYLTPTSFERGLVEAKFPNPGAAGPPYYQASVDFANNDHTMVADNALAWWSDSIQGYSGLNTNGGFCYVGKGIRFKYGSWPATPMPLFDESTCR